MRQFNDSGPEQAAYRLGDLFEVSSRVRRLGVRHAPVYPDLRAVLFNDLRIEAEVTLTIEPWFDGGPGWYWYMYMTMLDGFVMGPMSLNRRILRSPYPRQVVRAYQQQVRLDMKPLHIKRCS
jgi:hypothetical protein